MRNSIDFALSPQCFHFILKIPNSFFTNANLFVKSINNSIKISNLLWQGVNGCGRRDNSLFIRAASNENTAFKDLIN